MNQRRELFTKHYFENLFGGKVSKSGPGSDVDQTITLKAELPILLQELGIKTLVDAPCGDFFWMNSIINDLPIEKYIGIDIVADLILFDNLHYLTEKASFECRDLVLDFPNKGDLWLCRDCLCHLSFESIWKILKNFCNSNIEYMLTTTFTKENRINVSFPDGTNWFPISLTKPPFNLPSPSKLLNENCTEGNGDYNDKCLGLWRRKDIFDYVAHK